MKVTYLKDEQEILDFVARAAAKFAAKPKLATYTDKKIEPGCLFAVKWGTGNDCVLVLRLDEYFVPTVYGQVIPTATGTDEEPGAITKLRDGQ